MKTFIITINKIFILCAILVANFSLAQDKHIDPSSEYTQYHITFAKHTSTDFDAARIDDFLKLGTEALQTCNNKVNDEQDVACKVGFDRDGTLKDFGTAGDGLDFITNNTDYIAIQKNNSAFTKIVTGIVIGSKMVFGKSDGIPSSSIVVTRNFGNGSVRTMQALGQTFVHEFGHAQGLYHRDEGPSPIPFVGMPIMYKNEWSGVFNEVNAFECNVYHNGNNHSLSTVLKKNRPVDLEFTIDDTGSMSEEIDGVKQAIIDVLNNPKFSENSCGTTFQLSTFKDDVTIRDPTTDLNIIKNQVSALFASGGGDCPEGSAEAVDAVKDNVKDNANIYIATDAAPHPGYDITASTASLKARGVKVNILLSGDCYSTSLKTAGETDKVPYSDNKAKVSSNTTVVAAAGSLTTAIEAFSYMANETGGIFTYIPEVNFGTANDKQRYQNIWYNMILSSISPTITLADPAKGPVGGTVAITIRGTNTHFNSTTKVSFADSKISVQSIKVFGPTSVQAVVKIDPSTSLGLKDLSATTKISDGTQEKIDGIGLFEVISAPTFPNILSVSPSSGKQNQKLTVTITGINTHFSNSSIVNMGSGITILKVNAKSDVLLDADIKIDSLASVGFRSIVVTTGSETASEFVTGPFLVVESSCDLTGLTAGPDRIVNPDSKDSACVTLSVKGITGDVADYQFFWSTGETTQSIKVCPTVDTTYTVIVTKGTCTFSDDVVVTIKHSSGGGSTISIADAKVSESSRIAFIPVRLSQPVSKIVSVKYTTVDKTAKQGSDYVKVSGTLYFIPKVNQVAYILVPILKDNINEGNETFEIVLSNPVNADVADGTSLVTIVDNDDLLISGNEDNNTIDINDYAQSSTNVLDNSVMADFNKAILSKQGMLSIDIFPNPSSKSFTIQLSGSDVKNKAFVRVYDAVGKVVESRENVSVNQSFKIGEKYSPGTYFIYAVSGKGKAQARIVKLKE